MKTFFWTILLVAILSSSAVVVQSSGATATTASNGRIAFASSLDGVHGYDIYLMNPDGTGRINLTNTPATNDINPDWSPDGTKIVFSSRPDPGDVEDYDVYVMNSDGTNIQQLTNVYGADVNTKWSPDGSKILIESRRDGYEQIYVMNADGTGQSNLSSNTFRDFQPEWSPDGSKIVFMSIRAHPNQQIYVMNADGTGVTRLTFTTSLDFDPAWSPDGAKISFVSDRVTATLWQVYTMNPDGSSQTKLPDTNDNFSEQVHAWSPDGTKLAVKVDEKQPGFADSQIWIYSLDGTSTINISQYQAHDLQPSWERIEPSTVLGFYHPVDMDGILNTVKGGSTVPLKFEVFAGTEEVTDPEGITLTVTIAACYAADTDPIEELSTPGSTVLSYDIEAGQFKYNWKTPKQPGACYDVNVLTADGGTLQSPAHFKLT